MAPPGLVSVLIPTRDAAATLGALLEALVAQRAPFPVEVVIVDSGSRDATRAIAARHAVRFHEIPAASFDHGETRNLGIRLAQGEIVALLTQDAIPAGPHFLEKLVARFDDPRVAGVYGRQIPREDCDVVTRRQLEGWLTGRLEPAVARLEGVALEALPPAERHRLCAFDNVCSALRRRVWQDLPFPRSAWGEDLAWGRAVISAGWSIAYEPAAAVHHSHRRSIAYEYRRTRICHRRLHELFGLATLPARRYALRAAAANLLRDLPYVWRRAPPGLERWRQLARVAGLSVASPLAQYHGFRSARRAQRRSTT